MADEPLLRKVAKEAFHRAGGLQMVRWMNRKSARILMYHHFENAAALERQCAHIRENYSAVSLTEIGAWIRNGDPLPDNPLAITVDDGYRDFFTVAYPIFSRYEIPATVYLVTDFVDGKLWLWVDQVKYLFRHTPLDDAAFTLPGGEDLDLTLGSGEERDEAAFRVTEAAKRLPNRERLALLEYLPRELRVTLPECAPDEYAALRWADIAEMAGGLIEFGVHTRTHPILSSLSRESELYDEVSGAKKRVEEMVDAPVRHFCYPNGRTRDIGPDAVEAVRLAKFDTGVAAETGVNYPADDRLMLRRIGVETGLPEPYFQQCAAAFRV